MLRARRACSPYTAHEVASKVQRTDGRGDGDENGGCSLQAARAGVYRSLFATEEIDVRALPDYLPRRAWPWPISLPCTVLAAEI